LVGAEDRERLLADLPAVAVGAVEDAAPPQAGKAVDGGQLSATPVASSSRRARSRVPSASVTVNRPPSLAVSTASTSTCRSSTLP
jgi:hypothetical protein